MVSAIIRTLQEEHKKSPDLTRAILLFINGYMMQDQVIPTQELMSLFTILTRIQSFENKRFERIREKHQALKKRVQAKPSLAKQLIEDTRFMNTVITKQNQIFYLSLLISRMIVEQIFESEMGDINHSELLDQLHSHLKLIVSNLDRNDQALILLTLEVISDIVQRAGIPKDIKSTYLSLRLKRFFDGLVYLTPY